MRFTRILVLVLTFSLIMPFVSLANEIGSDEFVLIDVDNYGTVSKSFTNEAGEPYSISVTRVDKPVTYDDYLYIGDHSYNIYLTTGFINAWYTIDVSHPFIGEATINSAYDEDYITIASTVSEDILTINNASETSSSPAKATYKLKITVIEDAFSTTISLIASLKDGKLKVSTK